MLLGGSGGGLLLRFIIREGSLSGYRGNRGQTEGRRRPAWKMSSRGALWASQGVDPLTAWGAGGGGSRTSHLCDASSNA